MATVSEQDQSRTTGQFRATLAKRRDDVAKMFDGVAERYDLMNDLMTMGIDRDWRRHVVQAVAARPGELVLDLAAGTGTSSRPFADAGATVVPADLSLGMLRVGKQRQADLPFVNADGLQLPFADAAFDATTISFGLRNVEHTEAALAELLRVTKPGGRVVICEFSTPTWKPFATVYKGYLLTALPALGRVFSSNATAYTYLADSIRTWPTQAELAAMMHRVGWSEVAWRNLSSGIVAVHHAVRP